jgi:hypothetical protein
MGYNHYIFHPEFSKILYLDQYIENDMYMLQSPCRKRCTNVRHGIFYLKETLLFSPLIAISFILVRSGCKVAGILVSMCLQVLSSICLFFVGYLPLRSSHVLVGFEKIRYLFTCSSGDIL